MNQIRERWPDTPRFIVAAIGAAIGVSAFTGLAPAAIRHGGGAFFIPWLIAIATAAVPMMSLEFGLGLCYQGSAAEGFRKIHKRLEWIGWWTTGLCALAAVANCIFLAWCGLYLYDSLLALIADRPLPWGAAREGAQTYFQQTLQIAPAETPLSAIAGLRPVGSVLLALAGVWLLVFLTVKSGIAQLGKVAAVTVPVAVVLLFILGVGNLFEIGAIDGVAAFLTPDWSALTKLDTWAAAYIQVFQSLALGYGVYVAYGSYLNRNDDATGSAVITVLSGCGFALLSGVVVASALGVLAAAAGVPVRELGASGPELALIAYPAAIANLGLPSWLQALVTVVLLVCLIILAVNRASALVAAVVSALEDKFHVDWRRASAQLCLGGFLCGAVFATNLGPPSLAALNRFLFPFGIALAAAAQCISLAWVTGSGGLQRHLNAYSVIPVGGAWRAMVAVAVPVALIAVVASRIQDFAVKGVGDQPDWLLVGAGAVPCALALLLGLILGGVFTRKFYA